MIMKSKVVVYEIDQVVDDPFAPEIVIAANTKSWYGGVNSDGTWVKAEEAAGDWQVEKLDVGTYKITHYLANQNFSLNLSVTTPPGGASLLESYDMYFIVETKRDGELVDLPFSFHIAFSEKVSPALARKLANRRR